LDDAGYNIPFFVDKFVIQKLTFGFAEFLHDDLLRRLRGYAAKILWRHRRFKHIAYV
jgi:hypothetical protein